MGKLTVRGIESAKSKDRPYKLSDGDGLQLRVATDGAKTWLVRYIVKGVERQYRLPKLYRDIGGEAYCSLQDARDEARRIRSLGRTGVDYVLQMEANQLAFEQERAAKVASDEAIRQQDAANNITVQNMFEAWLADGVRRKDGNAELLRSFTADVLPKIGQIAIKDVSEHDLRAVLRAMVDRGVNRAAVIMRNDLTQMFAWAEKRQPWRKLLVDGDPMALIEIAKIVSPGYDLETERDRILNDMEIRELSAIFYRILNNFLTATNRRATPRPIEKTTQHAIWIMLSTTCRVGELSMAKWEDVDLDAGTWFIPKSNVKDNVAPLTVYLSAFSAAQFEALKIVTGSTPWCFPGRGALSHLDVKSISKQVGDRQSMFKKNKEGGARAPMKNRRHDNSLVLAQGERGAWTPHDLRRTGATLMQRLGVPLEIIDRCQNHVLPGSKTRRHYLHHDYALETADAWARLGAKLDSTLGAAESSLSETAQGRIVEMAA